MSDPTQLAGANHRQDAFANGFRQLWPGFNHSRQIGRQFGLSRVYYAAFCAALVRNPRLPRVFAGGSNPSPSAFTLRSVSRRVARCHTMRCRVGVLRRCVRIAAILREYPLRLVLRRLCAAFCAAFGCWATYRLCEMSIGCLIVNASWQCLRCCPASRKQRATGSARPVPFAGNSAGCGTVGSTSPVRLGRRSSRTSSADCKFASLPCLEHLPAFVHRPRKSHPVGPVLRLQVGSLAIQETGESSGVLFRGNVLSWAT